MLFDPPLIPATLLRRYKRFLADVRLPDGRELTVHCPNTGSMKNCVVEGSSCFLLDSNNPKRKYRYGLELITAECGHLAGVNTARANHLVAEAIENGVISALSGYSECLPEQRYGEENSRIDFLLRSPSRPDCYVEVKSVTLAVAERQGLFPDSVSARGQKHLRELMAMRAQGFRAVLVFCVQHQGIDSVAPADELDPHYGILLREAAADGVEVYAFRAELNQFNSRLSAALPVKL
ncbi:DNA/RNA nuclease SfsA [Teredinibacter waterburyi]|jgi:sugar fermentation stimulation protein|uniref:DNA/RNA nuclease SfsA n=1 Tax=Teredinibacter waterburyi TaxID=1500538 RepID=UPI00165F4536|nr:DNA/RNA nuclease SfsA [Teredinibacter waterburyi]